MRKVPLSSNCQYMLIGGGVKLDPEQVLRRSYGPTAGCMRLLATRGMLSLSVFVDEETGPRSPRLMNPDLL